MSGLEQNCHTLNGKRNTCRVRVQKYSFMIGVKEAYGLQAIFFAICISRINKNWKFLFHLKT